MPAQTIVILTDNDEDEFPIALPGIYRSNPDGDVEAALRIAQEGISEGKLAPNGELKLDRIEYVD